MPRKLPLVFAFVLVLPLGACGLFESKPGQDDIAPTFRADVAESLHKNCRIQLDAEMEQQFLSRI